MSFLFLHLKVFPQENPRKYIHVTIALNLANWGVEGTLKVGNDAYPFRRKPERVAEPHIRRLQLKELNTQPRHLGTSYIVLPLYPNLP